jgi:hypothetical protein
MAQFKLLCSSCALLLLLLLVIRVLLQQHNVAFISPQTRNSVTNYISTQLTQGGTGPGLRPLWDKGIRGLGEVSHSCMFRCLLYAHSSSNVAVYAMRLHIILYAWHSLPLAML